jgi:uncharacterized protein YoxC
MNSEISALCNELDTLAQAIRQAYPDSRTFAEMAGWNMPAVSGEELAAQVTALSNECRSAAPKELTPLTSSQVAGMITRIGYFKTSVLPNGAGGNSYFMAISFGALIASFRTILSPLLSWQALPKESLPPTVVKRIVKAQDTLSSVEAELSEVESTIASLQNAKSESEQLEQLLADAREALRRSKKHEDDAASTHNKMKFHLAAAEDAAKSIEKMVENVKSEVDAATNAHRAATSFGLSTAFSDREQESRESMRYWTAGLVMALLIGAGIGYSHYESISAEIAAGLSARAVVKTLLAFLGIGGSIWFAWLASLQIGYRFRLAEDYAMKAAAARSYEAYRHEAASVDPFLQAKLLASILVRFDEAPLRLIERDTHGSPIHAFLNSSAFQTAIDSSKEFKDAFIKFFSQSEQSIPPKKGE